MSLKMLTVVALSGLVFLARSAVTVQLRRWETYQSMQPVPKMKMVLSALPALILMLLLVVALWWTAINIS